MTLPAWKATGSSHETSVPWPPHVAGDFALCFVEDDSGAITTPSGWTLAGAYSISGVRLSIFWRFATSAAESNFAITGSANHNFGVIVTYTNVNALNPIHLIAFSNTGVDSKYYFVGLQTFLDDCLIVNALAWSADNAGPLSSGETNATLGSLTERFDGGTVTGNGGGLVILDGTLATAGVFDNTEVTLSAGSVSVVCTIALQAEDKTFGQKSRIVNNRRSSMPILVNQSTAQEVEIFMANASDGKTGMTGLTVAWTLRKNAETSLSSISPTTTDVGSGRYTGALTTTHMNTLGIGGVRATGTGADPADCPNMFDVVSVDKQSATRGLAGTALPAAAAAASGGLYIRGSGAGAINQDANGRIDVNVAAVSTDSTAADNLELQFDGTGLTGNTFPATQLQADTIDNFIDTEIATLSTDVGTLLTRLSATRAGYLDKLNITGNVANQASVDVIDGIVDAILAGALDTTDVTDAVGALVLRAGAGGDPDSTLLGHARRMDALYFGDVDGLNDDLVTAKQPGGATTEFERVQDPDLGTGEEVDRVTSES